MNKINNLKEILIGLGFSPRLDSNGYRMRPIYRESNNDSSLKVYENGFFQDFSYNIKGSLIDLVKLTKNLKTYNDAKKYLEQNNVSFEVIEAQEKLQFPKIWNPEVIDVLKRDDYSYWINKGISKDTIKIFDAGISEKNQMAGRFVFPIFNLDKSKIYGFAGRDITGKQKIKWKLLGDKSTWRYPLHVNKEIILEKKEIWLVESIGDMLSLWEAGIQNVFVLFGTEILPGVLKKIIELNPNKVIISTNNDEDNGFVGNMAANKIKKDLSYFFDKSSLDIKLPPKNDWGEMSKGEIKKFLLI